jgi:hypothetical protein
MTSKLQRTVESGNILVSSENPRIRIKVDEALTYVGGITKTLSGNAQAEIHYFVEPDSANQIHRRFHVQFEHFLPDNNHTYNYELPDRIKLGEHEYMHNAGGYAVQLVFDTRPDSDMAAGYNFLKSKGYNLPEEVLYRRFVRVIGEDRRAEILMIYTENAAVYGAPLADYAEGGPAHDSAEAIQEGMLQRALAAFNVIEG